MTEVTDILIWESPSVCLVASAVLVACLDTLSECGAYSGVGTGNEYEYGTWEMWVVKHNCVTEV